MEKQLEVQEEKKYNKFQWFLFVVLIPILFAVTLTLIVLTVAGINVFEKTKEYGQKIPFVSSLFEEEKPKSVEDVEKKVIALEAEIKDREAKIEQIEKKLEGKDQEIERARLEKERLEMEIEELTAIQNENKRAFKEIVQTYETMSPKKSAPIISQMKNDEAMKILTSIKPDTLAAIMEKMEPKDAAKYTELLTNESSNN